MSPVHVGCGATVPETGPDMINRSSDRLKVRGHGHCMSVCVSVNLCERVMGLLRLLNRG